MGRSKSAGSEMRSLLQVSEAATLDPRPRLELDRVSATGYCTTRVVQAIPSKLMFTRGSVTEIPGTHPVTVD